MCKSHCNPGRRASIENTPGSRYRRASTAPTLLKMAELMTAVKTGDLNFVRRMFFMLTEEEAVHVVKYQKPETRETLLFCACVKGHLEVVRFLLAMGRGQRDVCTAWGAGPIHAAAERCHEAVVRLLIKNGADVNAQTSYGDTPTHLAAYRGHYAIVRCLVEAGCDLDIRNSKGRTALDDATASKQGRIVQYLTAVMYPDTDGCAVTKHEGKLDNVNIDLMETRPLAPPIKIHQRLDRSISWHSCPSNSSSWIDEAEKETWQSQRRNSASSWESDTESSCTNNLSITTAGSPSWDAHRGMSVIPEVSDTAGSHHQHQLPQQQQQQRQKAAALPANPGTAKTCAEKRQDYRNRRASDSRVEQLERMVGHLRQGLAVTQEELGRTRLELRRARDLLRSAPRQTTGEDGPKCSCNDTARVIPNLRDRDIGQLY